MFIKLNALRNHVSSLGLAISFVAENRINVIVTPVVTEEASKHMGCLATPFALTGTPEELEAGFADQFDGFSGVFIDLATQTSQQIADIRAKAKAESEAAAAKKAKTLPSAKGKSSSSAEELGKALTGGTPTDPDVDDDDDDTGGTPSKLVTPAEAPPPVTPVAVSQDIPVTSLF